MQTTYIASSRTAGDEACVHLRAAGFWASTSRRGARTVLLVQHDEGQRDEIERIVRSCDPNARLQSGDGR